MIVFELVGILFTLFFEIIGFFVELVLSVLMNGVAPALDGLFTVAGEIGQAVNRKWKKAGPEWRWSILGVLLLVAIVLLAYLFSGPTRLR